jgi:hypothetical protein
MGFNEKGFEYEKQVISCLKAAQINGNISEPAGSSSHGADADFKINGQHNLEIKLNSNAQMGGTSVDITDEYGGYSIHEPVNDDALEKAILESVKCNWTDIQYLLGFISGIEGTDVRKFPLRCKKSTWTEAARRKLLINDKIPFDTSFICKHYARKNTNYIQIGGAGLFYMQENPADLPIPKLQGQIIIEMRTGRSGSKLLASGERVVGAGLRLQGRLKTDNKSPYTLDSVESINDLLGFLGAEQIKYLFA